jgi:hypothetical protein
MEENAQLRAEKMLQSTIVAASLHVTRDKSNTATTNTTTSFISQNVQNFFKNEDLSLYSTVSNKKLGSPPPLASATTSGSIDLIYPSGSGVASSLAATNRLRDNYFIKLENGEMQKSLNGNEFVVKKVKKQAGVGELAKNKQHGEK